MRDWRYEASLDHAVANDEVHENDRVGEFAEFCLKVDVHIFQERKGRCFEIKEVK